MERTAESQIKLNLFYVFSKTIGCFSTVNAYILNIYADFTKKAQNQHLTVFCSFLIKKSLFCLKYTQTHVFLNFFKKYCWQKLAKPISCTALAVLNELTKSKADNLSSSLVQSVERRTVNPYVAGSSPVGGAKMSIFWFVVPP